MMNSVSYICNKCGKEYNTNKDVIFNFYVESDYWKSYFEKPKLFDICENCLKEFIESFKIKPNIKSDKELVTNIIGKEL